MSLAVAPAPRRARLGLVLGGGGVRGLAHAGVLAGLEREGLRPQALVGVSMGALIAATYGAREDWAEALRSVDRSRLPMIAEPDEDYVLARLRGTLRNARRLVPSVWTLGRQGYEEYGREQLTRLLGAGACLEDFRLPVAVTATDLDARERRVFTRGEATPAVLASAAIPGLTRPYRIEGRAYIDGAFADPSPVDVARDLGADVVVGVHVGQHLLGTEADNWATALLRGFETSQRQFANERLTKADYVLRPEFAGRVTMLDFSAVDAVARCGVRCARSHAAAIAGLLGTAASA